jgi:transposase
VYSGSSLSELQRVAAVALFEEGFGRGAVAARLGVGRGAVARLHDRWRLRGAGALVTERGVRPYGFEFKLEVVRRYVAGEATAIGLAGEYGLSSPKLVQRWVREFQRGGEDALRPKPTHPVKVPPDTAGMAGSSELERLRAENLRLAAENAYLKKLRALREQGRD